jgi:hypothetical protein
MESWKLRITDPNVAPRKCVTGTKNNRKFKKRFVSPEDVPSRYRHLDTYYCDNCDSYHIGHKPYEPAVKVAA